MTYQKEESCLDINKKENRYESKSIIKKTYAGLQNRDNVKDNLLLFLQKK